MMPHSETTSEILFCVHGVGVEVVVHQGLMHHLSISWFVRVINDRATLLRLFFSFLTRHDPAIAAIYVALRHASSSSSNFSSSHLICAYLSSNSELDEDPQLECKEDPKLKFIANLN
ncbi:hypothetical protein ACFX16_000389 [Malus domestica]